MRLWLLAVPCCLSCAGSSAATRPERAPEATTRTDSEPLQMASGLREPPPEREPSPPAAAVGLTLPQIADVVSGRFEQIQRCYDGVDGNERDLEGYLAIAFTIAPDGSVQGACVAQSTLADEPMERCVLREFETMQFPSAPKPTGVQFPFHFFPKP